MYVMKAYHLHACTGYQQNVGYPWEGSIILEPPSKAPLVYKFFFCSSVMKNEKKRKRREGMKTERRDERRRRRNYNTQCTITTGVCQAMKN